MPSQPGQNERPVTVGWGSPPTWLLLSSTLASWVMFFVVVVLIIPIVKQSAEEEGRKLGDLGKLGFSFAS